MNDIPHYPPFVYMSVKHLRKLEKQWFKAGEREKIDLLIEANRAMYRLPNPRVDTFLTGV